MKTIIFTRPDGGVSVIHPAPKARFAEEAEDAFIARIRDKDVPMDALEVQIIDEALIPSDRTFRNAWKSGSGKIEHDMLKCRELWRERMRQARAPKLADLDTQYMRALERGEDVATIVAKKQALRDVTVDPAIETATTPEALKMVWPDILR